VGLPSISSFCVKIWMFRLGKLWRLLVLLYPDKIEHLMLKCSKSKQWQVRMNGRIGLS